MVAELGAMLNSSSWKRVTWSTASRSLVALPSDCRARIELPLSTTYICRLCSVTKLYERSTATAATAASDTSAAAVTMAVVRREDSMLLRNFITSFISL